MSKFILSVLQIQKLLLLPGSEALTAWENKQSATDLKSVADFVVWLSNPYRQWPGVIPGVIINWVILNLAPTHYNPLQPIPTHSNLYLVPVFYVPTCFMYLCAYVPSWFTCPYAYIIHFYALCCLCLYTLCAFVCVNMSGLFKIAYL